MKSDSRHQLNYCNRVTDVNNKTMQMGDKATQVQGARAEISSRSSGRS